MVYHALPCPKGRDVLVQRGSVAKEWGELRVKGLTPSGIYYKPLVNSKIVQGERPGAGAWIVEGAAWDDIMGTWGDHGGGSEWNYSLGRAALGYGFQEESLEDKRADIVAHGLWKWVTTALFDVQIVNFDAGSYLRISPEKVLAQAKK